jgi:hypothetical protein
VVEVYPSLWSSNFAREGRNGDQHDAYSAAAWMRRADLDGSLAAFLNTSPYWANVKTPRDQCRRSIPAGFALQAQVQKVQSLCELNIQQNQCLISAVLNSRSPEVWRKMAGEKEFWVFAGASRSGGLCAKARVYWDFCALVRRQRILDEGALAEGEELDSNLLSLEFALVRTTMVRGRKSQGKGGEIPQKIRRSAGAAKALSGNTPGSNDPLLNEQRTQFARIEYFSS